MKLPTNAAIVFRYPSRSSKSPRTIHKPYREGYSRTLYTSIAPDQSNFIVKMKVKIKTTS